MNKRIAIVSSYSDSCGNAYFTKILEEGLTEIGVSASCSELNLELTQSIEGAIRNKANDHISELCFELSKMDGVNIQVETGLYGSLPNDVLSRLKKLISANANTSITLHSPRITGNAALQRSAIKSALKGKVKQAIAQWMAHNESMIHVKLNRKIVEFASKRGTPIIVHTMRAKNQIKTYFGYDNVHVHPLKIAKQDREIDSSKLRRLKERFKIPEESTVIGMFGFINEYKGHTLALEALSLLPSNFFLFVFGRVHPQSIKQNEVVNPYLLTLQKLVKSKELGQRVIFAGEHSTDDFIDYAGSVDCVWLPYVELGQDGSGIASICCDVSKRVLASTSFAFDELLRLIPYKSVERFDIGNALELAKKTEHLNAAQEITQTSFNTGTQASLYATLLHII